MECERGRLVSPIEEVPVIEGEIVTAIRELADRGWVRKPLRVSWASRCYRSLRKDNNNEIGRLLR